MRLLFIAVMAVASVAGFGIKGDEPMNTPVVDLGTTMKPTDRSCEGIMQYGEHGDEKVRECRIMGCYAIGQRPDECACYTTND